jgi:hypothetical protein
MSSKESVQYPDHLNVWVQRWVQLLRRQCLQFLENLSPLISRSFFFLSLLSRWNNFKCEF